MIDPDPIRRLTGLITELEQAALHEDRRYKHPAPRVREYVRVPAALLLAAAKELRKLRADHACKTPPSVSP
jgi:hypothetical protein